MRMTLQTGLATAISMAALAAAAPAHASFIPISADGLTYTLTESTLTPLEDQFVLGISGINAATDTEGGRFGVQAIAFTVPANYSSASAAGFTLHPGQFGASGGGCDQPGGFFCLQSNTNPSTLLAANSSLSITFDITLSSGDFSSYVPHMKIDWLGTKNHYDLVSEDFTSGSTTPPSSVPEPASLALFGIGLLGLGLMARPRMASITA